MTAVDRRPEYQRPAWRGSVIEGSVGVPPSSYIIDAYSHGENIQASLDFLDELPGGGAGVSAMILLRPGKYYAANAEKLNCNHRISFIGYGARNSQIVLRGLGGTGFGLNLHFNPLKGVAFHDVGFAIDGIFPPNIGVRIAGTGFNDPLAGMRGRFVDCEFDCHPMGYSQVELGVVVAPVDAMLELEDMTGTWMANCGFTGVQEEPSGEYMVKHGLRVKGDSTAVETRLLRFNGLDRGCRFNGTEASLSEGFIIADSSFDDCRIGYHHETPVPEPGSQVLRSNFKCRDTAIRIVNGSQFQVRNCSFEPFASPYGFVPAGGIYRDIHADTAFNHCLITGNKFFGTAPPGVLPDEMRAISITQGGELARRCLVTRNSFRNRNPALLLGAGVENVVWKGNDFVKLSNELHEDIVDNSGGTAHSLQRSLVGGAHQAEDGDQTPSASDATLLVGDRSCQVMVLLNAGPTNITNIDEMLPGDEIVLTAGNAMSTIKHNAGQLELNGGVDFNMLAGNRLILRKMNDRLVEKHRYI